MSEGPPFNLLTAHDSYLFNQGSHFRLYDKLDARVVTVLALRNFTPVPRGSFWREAFTATPWIMAAAGSAIVAGSTPKRWRTMAGRFLWC